jgi:hypothetical protein
MDSRDILNIVSYGTFVIVCVFIVMLLIRKQIGISENDLMNYAFTGGIILLFVFLLAFMSEITPTRKRK